MTYRRKGRNIKIGKNVKIGDGVIIYDNVIIKDNVTIHPYAIIGNTPQHTTEIGDIEGYTTINEGTTIREFVTIHSPISKDLTYIGKNCYIMATAHIGHDCYLHDNVVLANSVNLSGYTKIHNNAMFGLNATTHQYTTIGSFAMIGMNTPINRDVLPYTVAYGNPARWYKMNRIGLQRHRNEKTIKAVEEVLSWGKQHVNYVHTLDKKLRDLDIVGLGKKSDIKEVRKSFEWFDNNRNRGNRKLIKYAGEVGYNLEYVI